MPEDLLTAPAPTAQDAPAPASAPATIPAPTPAGLPDLRDPGSFAALLGTDAPAEAPPATDDPAATSDAVADDAPAPEPTEADAAPEPAPTFKVPVPLPNGNGENGPTNAGTLELDLPTQEAADTLRYHLKQSARAQRLDGRLREASADTATVDFLEQSPAEGMLWIAQQHPEAGDRFLDTMVRAHPDKVVAALTQMGLQVSVDPAKEETILARAELARRDAKDAVAKGQTQFQGQRAVQTYRAAATEVVEDLTASLGLAADSEEYEVFATRAASRLTQLYQQKGAQATPADMTAALQPLVQALRPAAPPAPHHSQTQPRAKDGTFADPPKDPAALIAKNARLRQLAGAAGANAPVPAAVTKVAPTASLYDLQKAVRGF